MTIFSISLARELWQSNNKITITLNNFHLVISEVLIIMDKMLHFLLCVKGMILSALFLFYGIKYVEMIF